MTLSFIFPTHLLRCKNEQEEEEVTQVFAKKDPWGERKESLLRLMDAFFLSYDTKRGLSRV